jgi:hypothetical protein
MEFIVVVFMVVCLCFCLVGSVVTFNKLYEAYTEARDSRMRLKYRKLPEPFIKNAL